MLGPGGSGGEIVRNSALSFVACAQPAEEGSPQDHEEDNQSESLVPAGLKSLCEAYSRLYPDQTNPLQVTTRLKYWLGGHDPLDYISMYWNAGKPEENISPHWHYVSFGLSDLHGDGRVHAPPDRVLAGAVGAAGGAVPPSGLGVELTFRLEAPAPAHAPPPLWPAALLQALARYLFSTGNKFVPGDHISWHCALDGGAESRVRHLLVAADPQLCPLRTPHGAVTFIQMVGCTGRELRAAQRGSGCGVLHLMADDPECGGAWLVTRMRRRSSARARPAPAAPAGPPAPLHLAGVSARVRWEPWTPTPEEDSPPQPRLPPTVERQIKETLQRGLITMSSERSGSEGHSRMSTDSFEMSSIERALPRAPQSMQGSWRSESGEDGVSGAELGGGWGWGWTRARQLAGAHVVLGAEGASLLPLALRGRVLHGQHFTWRAPQHALTLLAPAVRAARATTQAPYAAQGPWLQVIIPEDLARDMLEKVSKLAALADTDSESDDEREGDKQTPILPLTFTWIKQRLKITVVPDHEV